MPAPIHRVGTAATPGYAFTGREWDPETGLYYYRARYYDPPLGRFISEDPLPITRRALRELHAYAYVGNNPVNVIDPWGLERVYEGQATYYNLPGNKTASGEPFDATTFTAAMTAEKANLGDTVTVEYNNGNKTNSVCVRVNDRGPFARDAKGKPIKPLTPDPNIIIDLTPEAFKKLVGSLGPGRVPVTVRVP